MFPVHTNLRRALAAALAAALVMSGLAATASAAPRHELTITGPTAVRLGKQATLKISWRKNGSRATGPVRLQEKRAGAWVDVGKVRVTNGKARVKVSPGSTTRYRVRKGTRSSKAVKVKVTKGWIATKVADPSIRAGEAARINLSNFRKGVRSPGKVRLERKNGKGWRSVRTIELDASGRTTVRVTPTKDATYRFVRGKVTSAERTVKVTRTWASLELASTQLESSASTTTATVRWYQNGKRGEGTVTLQEKVPGGKWQKVRDVQVSQGTATLTLQPRSTRSYRVVAGSTRSAAVRATVESVVPASFRIHGSGWGHGLGMSQYGAYAMAQEGWSVEDILTHYYTDTSVEDLAFPTGKAKKQQLKVQVIGPSPYARRASDNRTTVPVTVRGGGWALRDKDGVVTKSSSGDTVTFKIASGKKIAAYVGQGSTPVATATRFELRWDGTRYRKATGKQATVEIPGANGTYRHGRLDIRVVNGQLNIVNELLLNTEYLYGIAEMPSSWGEKGGAAALQAQAIAARNYAASAFLDSAGKPVSPRSSCRCHLVDDVYDQNFTGWKKEGEGTSQRYGKLWKAAVDATVGEGGATGKVLRYTGSDKDFRGKLVTAYYSSSSGGATLNSEDAWSARLPYIRSVDDPWSLKASSGNPNVTWTATMTQREARAFFSLPDVVSIEVSKVYAGGGMAQLTATSSSGQTKSRSGKADVMRTSLNSASSGYVKSAFVRAFEPVGVF